MSDPIRFEFNTGRQYAANGQLIKCVYRWHAPANAFVIAFTDVSRGIPGWFPYSGRTDLVGAMRDAVMAAYDNQAYAQGWLEYDATRG